MVLHLVLLSAWTTHAAIVIPPHVPDVWGGAAYGATLGHSSHLFAFSGADGPTSEGSVCHYRLPVEAARPVLLPTPHSFSMHRSHGSTALFKP